MGLETIGADEMHRLYEMYMNYCENHDFEPSVRDWVIWLSEEGYIDED